MNVFSKRNIEGLEFMRNDEKTNSSVIYRYIDGSIKSNRKKKIMEKEKEENKREKDIKQQTSNWSSDYFDLFLIFSR